MQKITTFLWFDTQAEEGANFYVSVFKNSGIESVSRYPAEGEEATGKKAGAVRARLLAGSAGILARNERFSAKTVRLFNSTLR